MTVPLVAAFCKQIFCVLFISWICLPPPAHAAFTPSTVNEMDVAYELPVLLYGHFSGVHNDVLYVWGGKFCDPDANPCVPAINMDIFSLDLAAMSISTNGLDIAYSTSTLWTTTALSYASLNTDGRGGLFCLGQCSVQVGQYVYILGPDTAGADGSEWMYVFDLATLAFLTTGYETNLPTTGVLKGACVTSDGDDTVFLLGGRIGSEYKTECYKYAIGTQTFSSIAAFLGGPGLSDTLSGRQFAGCATSFTGETVFLAGGRGSTATVGYTQMQLYSVSGNSWDDGGWTSYLPSTSWYASPEQHYSKCFHNPFQHAFGCISGLGNVANALGEVSTANYFEPSTVDTSNATVALNVYQYGLAAYAYDTGAALMVVTGGKTFDAGDLPTNVTQYAVVLQGPTSAPSRAPTTVPSQVPSTMPTMMPSGMPSAMPSPQPTMEPTTGVPSMMPTTGQPTDSTTSTTAEPGGKSAAQRTRVTGLIMIGALMVAMACIMV